jgi:hypothetical protein
MRGSGKPDPPASPYLSPRLTGFEPQPLARKELRSVKGAIDLERFAQTARTAAEIARVLDVPPFPHEREAFYRFERAHQHPGALAVGFAR